MTRAVRTVLALLLLPPAPAAGQGRYLVGVVSESGDRLTWLRPEGGTLAVDRIVPLGLRPADLDGPHGLAIAPDQRSYYVTMAHGTPFGSVWRLDAATDSVLGRAEAWRFPSSLAPAGDGTWLFVANSDFHGPRPAVNPVSIIHTPTMTTVRQLPACDMPHGMRASGDGRRVYLACMHDDLVLELDAERLEPARRLPVGADHDCMPTWVSVSPDDTRLYVACQAAGTLRVFDRATLAPLATVPVGSGAYQAEPSPDGRWVLVTNKAGRSVSVVDAAALVERARIPTTKPVVHGIAYSPDGRYGYISCESVGADPGSVDIIDLDALTLSGSVAVPAQPAGIAVLRR